MPEFEIIRFASHDKLGCPGVAVIGGVKFCDTIEQPWRDNKPYKSCVPAGDYGLMRHNSSRFGEVFALVNHDLGVFYLEDEMHSSDQRFLCLLAHKGSYQENFKGCIGAGEDYTLLGESFGITNTRNTAPKLVEHLIHSGIIHVTIRYRDESDPLEWFE